MVGIVTEVSMIGGPAAVVISTEERGLGAC